MGSAPAGFAQLAVGYRARHSGSKEDLKRGIAHVSWKSHQNGVHSPKAHLRKAISMDAILGAPMIAEPLRSEEHTSELQSLMRISYAVFCLKKKRTSKIYHHFKIQHI